MKKLYLMLAVSACAIAAEKKEVAIVAEKKGVSIVLDTSDAIKRRLHYAGFNEFANDADIYNLGYKRVTPKYVKYAVYRVWHDTPILQETLSEEKLPNVAAVIMAKHSNEVIITKQSKPKEDSPKFVEVIIAKQSKL
jgi:hypothetical protein